MLSFSTPQIGSSMRELSEPVVRCLNQLEEWAVRVIQLDPMTGKLQGLLAEFELERPGGNPKVSCDFIGAGQPRIIIHIYCEKMDMITVLLRFLGRHGIHQDGDVQDIQLLNNLVGCRQYPMTNNIVVEGMFLNLPNSNRSDACRYVQTGTKEVPVYELRCDKTEEVES